MGARPSTIQAHDASAIPRKQSDFHMTPELAEQAIKLWDFNRGIYQDPDVVYRVDNLLWGMFGRAGKKWPNEYTRFSTLAKHIRILVKYSLYKRGYKNFEWNSMDMQIVVYGSIEPKWLRRAYVEMNAEEIRGLSLSKEMRESCHLTLALALLFIDEEED